MKCSCDAERSLSAEARHLAMNSYGVMGAFSVADNDRHLPGRGDGACCHPRRTPFLVRLDSIQPFLKKRKLTKSVGVSLPIKPKCMILANTCSP